MLLRPLRRLIPSPRHARPHFQPRLFSSSPIRQLFGLRIPEASNEPLAGTDGSGGPPLLFLLQVVIGLPTLLWIYKVGLFPFPLPSFSRAKFRATTVSTTGRFSAADYIST